MKTLQHASFSKENFEKTRNPSKFSKRTLKQKSEKDNHSKFSKKAQMKIQQMAFMLVAVMIFFAMIALIYFSISLANLKAKAEQLREDEAIELVRQFAGTPEFAFTSSTDCVSCIDLDKVFYLKGTEFTEKFWNLNYLMIEKVYPDGFTNTGIWTECSGVTYPNCNIIKLIDGSEYQTKTAFVSLAHWDTNLGNTGGWRYELGRIHASPKEPS